MANNNFGYKKYNMKLIVYGTSGEQIETFENVDENSLSIIDGCVRFTTANETVTIVNAITIARKPKN